MVLELGGSHRDAYGYETGRPEPLLEIPIRLESPVDYSNYGPGAISHVLGTAISGHCL